MEIWLGTTNQGKIRELRPLLERHQFEIHTLSELRGYTAPPETGKTFTENARIKARSLKAVRPGVWVLAEDSGLVVDGLNGLPGIHSARYAGDHASDSENTAKLLKMVHIRSPLMRTARFVCHMVVFNPQGEELIFEGSLEGEIGKTQKGTLGFGYDPIFVPTGSNQSLAEIEPGQKNQMSHRGQAVKKFLSYLDETSKENEI